MEQGKKHDWLIPFGALIFCFIVVVLSISMIINMAESKLNVEGEQLQNMPYKEVTELIQTPSNITYQMYETKLSASFNSQSIDTQLKLNPRIENLPLSEQNSIIRLKLMEWRIGYFQNQLDRLLSSTQEPLIFKVWFWIFSLFAWAGSIVGGKILTFFSQKYIIERYWDN